MPPLRPNPPRLVTVALAVALAVIGLVLALPIPAGLELLGPVAEIVAPFGIALDRDLGYLCLFVSPGLLVAGSLLPGI